MPLQRRPKVLLVTTGGTITMFRNEEGSLSPCEDSGQLFEKIPELRQLADIDILHLTNLDSSNLQPDLWISLGQAIYQRFAEYDGFVVTHGTDTLCYTSSALAFILQELPKPVILTGSQVPLDEIGSDGRANLINAVRVAISDIAEVAVVFGSLIIRGTRAKKTSVFDLQAFTSVNAGAQTPGPGVSGGNPRRHRSRRLRGGQSAYREIVADSGHYRRHRAPCPGCCLHSVHRWVDGDGALSGRPGRPSGRGHSGHGHDPGNDAGQAHVGLGPVR